MDDSCVRREVPTAANDRGSASEALFLAAHGAPALAGCTIVATRLASGTGGAAVPSPEADALDSDPIRRVECVSRCLSE